MMKSIELTDLWMKAVNHFKMFFLRNKTNPSHSNIDEDNKKKTI